MVQKGDGLTPLWIVPADQYSQSPSLLSLLAQTKDLQLSFSKKESIAFFCPLHLFLGGWCRL